MEGGGAAAHYAWVNTLLLLFKAHACASLSVASLRRSNTPIEHISLSGVKQLRTTRNFAGDEKQGHALPGAGKARPLGVVAR